MNHVPEKYKKLTIIVPQDDVVVKICPGIKHGKHRSM